MPTIRNHNKYRKVYRPNGARYTNGPTRHMPASAVLDAISAFQDEHGRQPRDIHTVIEVVGVTGGYTATVFEIED